MPGIYYKPPVELALLAVFLFVWGCYRVAGAPLLVPIARRDNAACSCRFVIQSPTVRAKAPVGLFL